MENTRSRWILIASIVLLLWNLSGVAAFFSQWTMTAKDIAALPDIQQDMWNHATARGWTAYAVAVSAGTLGAIGLLLGRRWATPLFAISLIAVIVQFTAPNLIDIATTKDASIMAFPLFIFAMAVTQAALAWRWAKSGLLA